MKSKPQYWRGFPGIFALEGAPMLEVEWGNFYLPRFVVSLSNHTYAIDSARIIREL
jgi:hypothetical protein